MRYICTECHFVYDESLGLEEENISPSTYFYELGDDFVCPSCECPSEHFDLIKDEVVYFDKNMMTDLEDMHFPKIKIAGEKIKVKIGKTENHPMEEDHFISSVMLYDEYGDLVQEKFLKPGQSNEISFDLQGLDEFEIRIRCNKHGVFGSELIKV